MKHYHSDVYERQDCEAPDEARGGEMVRAVISLACLVAVIAIIIGMEISG